mmetsp:Transcript_61532/g.85612  ORF Transcript_61532/g.85612 Transcript_61532/m.85612 type:complete len:145 (+) Transcript_61532:180-614(+)
MKPGGRPRLPTDCFGIQPPGQTISCLGPPFIKPRGLRPGVGRSTDTSVSDLARCAKRRPPSSGAWKAAAKSLIEAYGEKSPFALRTAVGLAGAPNIGAENGALVSDSTAHGLKASGSKGGNSTGDCFKRFAHSWRSFQSFADSI